MLKISSAFLQEIPFLCCDKIEILLSLFVLPTCWIHNLVYLHFLLFVILSKFNYLVLSSPQRETSFVRFLLDLIIIVMFTFPYLHGSDETHGGRFSVDALYSQPTPVSP